MGNGLSAVGTPQRESALNMTLFARLGTAAWWLPFGHVAEISALELKQQLEQTDTIQLLDVRTHMEWTRSRIAGSVNVPVGKLRSRLPSLGLDPQRPVVAICLSAHRSIPAVRLLRSHGFESVCQLHGGMLAWWHHHLPTE